MLFKNLDIKGFETIKPLLEELVNRSVDSKTSLENWIQNVEELQAVLTEKERWISLNAKKDTSNEKFQALSNTYFSEVHPKIAPFYNQFDHKLINSEYVSELNKDQYFIYLRNIKGGIRLYREENVALFAKTTSLTNEYFNLRGK